VLRVRIEDSQRANFFPFLARRNEPADVGLKSIITYFFFNESTARRWMIALMSQ
jgi:hypothetical protein